MGAKILSDINEIVLMNIQQWLMMHINGEMDWIFYL